jgi:hypothetical protein
MNDFRGDLKEFAIASGAGSSRRTDSHRRQALLDHIDAYRLRLVIDEDPCAIVVYDRSRPWPLRASNANPGWQRRRQSLGVKIEVSIGETTS